MVYLPPELYRSILGQLNAKRDLCAVARVSHLLRSESEPLIYRDLNFDMISPLAKSALCRRVCSSNIIPLYVQSLTWSLMDFETPLVALLLLISRVLRRVQRLRTLALTLEPLATRLVRFFEGCGFKLLVLQINCDEDFGSSSLFPFLETQNELKLLGVSNLPNHHHVLPDRPLPNDFLPKITALHAPFNDCARLAPGRPITHLSSQSRASSLSLHPLALSTGQLKVLVIGTDQNHDGSLQLPTLPDLFPCLEALYLVFSEPRRNQADTLVETFSRFKKLKRLVLRLSAFFAIADENIALQRLVVACPSLRTVTIKSSYWRKVATWDIAGLLPVSHTSASWWENEMLQ